VAAWLGAGWGLRGGGAFIGRGESLLPGPCLLLTPPHTPAAAAPQVWLCHQQHAQGNAVVCACGVYQPGERGREALAQRAGCDAPPPPPGSRRCRESGRRS
jgi:hypothetical protein